MRIRVIKSGLKNAFDGSPALLLQLDSALIVRDLSGTWREKIGLGADAEIAHPLNALINLERSHKLEKQLMDLLETGEALTGEVAELVLPKSYLLVSITAWRATDPETNAPYILILARDRKAETVELEAITQLKNEHKLILDSAGEGIWGLDREGLITFGNKAAVEILGWEIDSVLGKSSHEIHHHSHADGTIYPRDECPIYASLQDGEIHRVDNEVFWHTNGRPIPVDYVSTPIFKNGQANGAVIVFRDITERKALERERELAYHEISELKKSLEQERDYLRSEINSVGSFGEIIGDSSALQRTLAQVAAVAATPASVLILGESGVGKELIARALHTQSDRSDKPLVKVNCASIPAELFESEFFGHVKGSFTGAHQDRVGRLQLADKGTLFLDEVGEIPLPQQGKLLRALQENEFEQVGDDKTIKVNVRVIAATNKNLQHEVKAGKFREDLFYRLSVFPLEVPPLRERINDILPLSLHFVEKICEELKRGTLRFSEKDISILKNYTWPGNIRELKNTIERAVILSQDKKIRLDLALDNKKVSKISESETTTKDTSYLTHSELKAFEKANIIAALQSANWKTWGENGAAELLGIKPSTLAYQMKQFGIAKKRLS